MHIHLRFLAEPGFLRVFLVQPVEPAGPIPGSTNLNRPIHSGFQNTDIHSLASLC